MGDLVALNGKLPAHLRGDDTIDRDEWESGTTTGFPVISLEGKRFTIKRGEDLQLVRDPRDKDEDEDEQRPASYIPLVILKTHKGVARTYYKKGYTPGSDDAPDCYSNNGIIPAADAQDRQSRQCANCPHAQWGSRITENGKKGKACSEVKRLAVAFAGQVNDPMLLRLPPTSLRAWDDYVDALVKRGVKPPQVITRVSFDPEVTHQQLRFKAIDFITPEMAEQAEEALADPMVEHIIGSATVEDLPDDGDDDAPPPRKRQPAKKSAKQVREEEEDDGGDDDAAPPPKRKRAPAKKQAPAKEPDPDEDEEDEEDDGGEDDDALAGLDDLDFSDLDFEGLD